jgi:hydroxyethylthiazole kinase-like uncharacterized protein yjeF
MRWPKPLLRAKPNVSKKDFGHVLVVAGSAPMLGAACLVSLAAMRAGAGLVTCAIPKDLNLTLQKKLSANVMTLPYKNLADIESQINRFTVLAIGPGLGVNKKTTTIVLALLKKFKGPIIIDADGLNIISKHLNGFKSSASKIITPHAGEMARLSKLPTTYIEKNRKQVAIDFARQYNCVVVLKGNKTVVASSTHAYVNATGNAGMAKAGMGDVLTGMIAALLAQNVPALEAARVAVAWHGKIADYSVLRQPKFSLLATDLIEAIKKVKL